MQVGIFHTYILVLKQYTFLINTPHYNIDIGMHIYSHTLVFS